MKIISFPILLFLCLFLSKTSFAQPQLTGSFGAHYIKFQEGYSAFSFSVVPTIGAQINENVALGGMLGYTHLTLKASNPYSYYGSSSLSTGVFSFGAYARFRTFGTEKIRVLLETQFAIGINNEGGNAQYLFTAIPVVQFEVSERVFFDAYLGLMGLSFSAVPEIDYYEINAGVKFDSPARSGTYNGMGSILSPLQVGFTFVLGPTTNSASGPASPER